MTDSSAVFLKLKARRFSSGKSVHILSAPSQLDSLPELLTTPDQWDVYDLLLTRQLWVDPQHMSHHLTFVCQQLFHSDLPEYLTANRSALRDTASALLSPIRGLRLVRDYFDVDTLDIPVAAHTALAFALKFAAGEHNVSAHLARDLFDAVAECALALTASYEYFQPATQSRLRAEHECPATAWRSKLLGAVLPAADCSSAVREKLHLFNQSSTAVDSDGALLLLVPDPEGAARPLSSSDFVEARLVLDARTLAAAADTSASSTVRALRRPLTIAAHLPPGAALLLHLSLVLSVKPQIELLGPFELVCQSLIIAKLDTDTRARLLVNNN